MASALKLVNGIPRMIEITHLYDSTYVATGSETAGTSITLPSSETYTSTELLVILNDVILELTTDYTYVGSAPRTQIQLTFDLVSGDRLRFRKEVK